jgi:hypothetical protein
MCSVSVKYRGRILGRYWDKSLKNFPPCSPQSPLQQILLPPPPPLFDQKWFKSGLKLVCNVNIVYGNLKSENSQDYAQEPQLNCKFMNSASLHGEFTISILSVIVLIAYYITVYQILYAWHHCYCLFPRPMLFLLNADAAYCTLLKSWHTPRTLDPVKLKGAWHKIFNF